MTRLSLATFVVLAGAIAASPSSDASDWTGYLGGPLHDSVTANAQITKAQASHLTLAWTWSPDRGTMSGQPSGGLYSSPIVYGGRIYIGAKTGDFYALDEATGHVLWKRFLGFQPAITCAVQGFVSTATVVDTSGTGANPVVYVAAPDGYLYALDGLTGATVWRSLIAQPSTTTNDAFNWSSPTIVGDRIYVGFSSNCDNPFIRGGLMEFDRVSGAQLAVWYGVPAGQIGGGVWSSAAVTSDGAYVSTGSAGATVLGDSYSIVRLDPTTLARVAGWMVPLADRQSAGDQDMGSSPIVFNATIAGVQHQLVGACNKDGFFYAMDTQDFKNPVWRFRIGAATAEGGDACLSSGAYDGSRLFLAGNETVIGGTDYQGSVRELDPATGSAVWERGLSANVLAAPTLNGAGVLAVSTHDIVPSGLANQTYLLDSDNGNVLAILNTSNQKEFAQPTFADQYLLLTRITTMYAYTPTTSSDVSAPSVPGGVSAAGVSSSEIDVSWSASQDNVGVAGYRVYRDGSSTPLATVTSGTSYQDIGLAAGVSHSYSVSAFDAAGNESAQSAAVSASTSGGGGTTTLSFGPVADASVIQSSATANFGSSTSLLADGDAGAQAADYLRFSVSGIAVGQTVWGAKLRLFVPSNGTGSGPPVYAESNTTWGESTITWNNRPAAASTATATSGKISAGTWVEYNVSPLVTGNGTYSFVVGPTPTTDGVVFNSREAGSNQPQLVLTTG
jgi:outer membrane protein assembly factor BamB